MTTRRFGVPKQRVRRNAGQSVGVAARGRIAPGLPVAPRWGMRIQSSVVRVLLLFTFVRCAVEPGAESEQIAVTAAPPPPPPTTTCTPADPIDPKLCSPYEPEPPPAPIDGHCDVELRVDSVSFLTGQGWFEGRAEASAVFTATDLSTGAVVTGSYPANGTIKMEVDKSHIANVALGTYRVGENKHKDVWVCATFTEADVLTKDDVGSDCETIRLECPQAGETKVLSADLCKGGNCSVLRGKMAADVKVETKDADQDCVANEDDYTPSPCDEALKGQLCHASLVYFAYEDGPLVNLVQNLGTDLAPAMTGYDRVVLLIDSDNVGPFNLNPAALALADVTMLPTEQNFFAALQDLTSRGCDITVWMFSHGAPALEAQLDGSVTSGGGEINAMSDDDGTGSPNITTDELLAEAGASGTPLVPVRMTYGTPCFYEEWNEAWTTIGAKVTAGAIDINFFPTYFGKFVANWNAGQTYGMSLAGEYSLAEENRTFGVISAQGLLQPWNCIAKTVLGKNPCAQNFFTDLDLQPAVDATGAIIDGPDEAEYGIGGPLNDTLGVAYDPLASGATNMRNSSAKVLVGEPSIGKNVPATLTWP